MAAAPPYAQTASGSTRLFVKATPKAARNSIEGVETDTAGKTWLKIKIAAPPEDGKANDELVRFLAKQLKIGRAAIVLASGASSRLKVLEIAAPAHELAAKLAAAIP